MLDVVGAGVVMGTSVVVGSIPELDIVNTSTVSGSAPFATPYRAVPGFVIEVDAIEPTLLLLPSSILAITLTAGDVCAVAVFFRSNVTTHAVPDVVPPNAAVSTSCPEDCVHTPLVPSRPDVEDTVKFAVFAVCDPVSPKIVTLDPVAKSTLAVNDTVNVLVAPENGLLCWIEFTQNFGAMVPLAWKSPLKLVPLQFAMSVLVFSWQSPVMKKLWGCAHQDDDP